jgi:predicted transcriptional regulator
MVGEKNIAVSFRVSPRFKKLLEEAASRENRSQTNMLETLLFSYCQQHDVELNSTTHKNSKAQTK